MRKGNLLAVLLIGAILVSIFWFRISSNLSNLPFLGLGQAIGYSNLVLENQNLKSELAQLQDIKNKLPSWSPNFIEAEVYSQYPFNFKNELLINAGEKQGIKIGQSAILALTTSTDPGNLILLGKVEKVFENSALIQTVFDTGFKSAVKVGASSTEALLTGGRATLIQKDGIVQQGDVVYSIDPQFPYGLTIGTVKSAGLSRDQVFQDADLDFGYNPNTLGNIFIIKNYVPAP